MTDENLTLLQAGREIESLRRQLEHQERLGRAAQAEYLRRQKQADRLLYDLAVNIAHQARNPLGIIQTLIQSQLAKKWLSKKQAQSLAAVSRTVESLNRRLDEIIDFSRPLELIPAAFDLGRFIEDTCLLVAEHCRSRSIELDCRAPASLAGKTIKADPSKLKIALLNILFNAMEAVSDRACGLWPSLGLCLSARGGLWQSRARHGHLREACALDSPAGSPVPLLRTQDTGHPSSAISAPGTITVEAEELYKENFFEIKIKDTGAGVRPEHMEMLGQPFFTTKEDGLGLGLAVAKRILHGHQGDLQIESVLGQGTTVRLRLPLKKEGI
ncbi:MAG: hypothetical protein HY747_05595 [Elusimicrobia bacterium]|nr:hypothetical protein [Elusimicrobiota bacterium]